MENPPLPCSSHDLSHRLQQWLERAGQLTDTALTEWMEEAEHSPLLAALFGNSPYLSRLLLAHPDILHSFTIHGADATYAQLMDALNRLPFLQEDNHTSLMQALRMAKGRLALLVALTDISEAWALEQVTRALSDFASACLGITIDHLLQQAQARGEITLPRPDLPSFDSGIIVLGMGKLGGWELNYSSDIDLILLFERGRLGYKGRHTEQHFMNKLAQALVQVMQERTRDGYVFRTDLRLRPDPASTPPAVSVEAAYNYYESLGQNWERAAMIKARPVAGDIEAGTRFLTALTPFMWRRNLDFAAINDIHSIKRQMDSRLSGDIQLAGHNIKLGLGGIREIEFFAQIHQLIWGGREPRLRTRATCETLSRLSELELLDEEKETQLYESYLYLRKLEHRLQMVNDEQTHSLPQSEQGLAAIACFMGYDDTESFATELLSHLHRVHGIYTSSFQQAGTLSNAGNLVFTGVSHDPDTLKTLQQMGYANPERVSEIVMGWHHGAARATRTQRARELLTELMPVLLKRLSETVDADTAFLKFNDFLRNLPAGVQLFSLFNANPHLLGLIADIMGSAPTLADSLSKSPALLDAVLYADFYGKLPSQAQLLEQLADALSSAHHFDERLEALRRLKNEKQFQAGVQLLKRMIDAQQCGKFLSALADLMLESTLSIVTNEFVQQYGEIDGSRFAIIAMGKLGSRELTFGSDIDLIFVYDAPNANALSTGGRQHSASVYYNRLSQRLLTALSGLSRGGRLYEVDTRLRPSGEQGLLAVSKDALAQYFNESAWTFEQMAFTKARAVAGDADLCEGLDLFIAQQLVKPRDGEKLRHDVLDMRARIEKEHGTANPFDIKYVQGGLMDIDFTAQYLMLTYAPQLMGAQAGSAADSFRWLQQAGKLDAATSDILLSANRFLNQLFHMLRLCSSSMLEESAMPSGLKKLLAESLGEKTFAALKKRLLQVEQQVHGHYMTFLTQNTGANYDRKRR